MDTLKPIEENLATALTPKEELMAYLRSKTPTNKRMYSRDELYEEALCQSR